MQDDRREARSVFKVAVRTNIFPPLGAVIIMHRSSLPSRVEHDLQAKAIDRVSIGVALILIHPRSFIALVTSVRLRLVVFPLVVLVVITIV